MIQFYSPDIEEKLHLSEEESAHCCRVLRMKEGEEIRVTDGRGNIFCCRIEKAHPKKAEISILEKNKVSSRNYSLTLAVAPTKHSDRMEWMVEKAEEIGVDKIVLLKCERSERKKINIDRLRRIMISAMNQSLSARLPQIEEMTDFKNFIENQGTDFQKFFGYCSDEFLRKEFVKECNPGGHVVIMIGPEGDFTQKEVDFAIHHGFKPVTFGDKRLRTETAAIFGVCAVAVINSLATPSKE